MIWVEMSSIRILEGSCYLLILLHFTLKTKIKYHKYFLIVASSSCVHRKAYMQAHAAHQPREREWQSRRRNEATCSCSQAYLPI